MTYFKNLCHTDLHVHVSGGVACCLAGITSSFFTSVLSLSLSRYVDDDVDSSSDEHDRIFEEDGIQVKDQVLGACTNKIESFFVSFLDK